MPSERAPPTVFGQSMPALKHILVATNGSPSSRRAVEAAVELAAAEGAQVRAVLVVPPSDLRVDVPRYGPTAFLMTHMLSTHVRDVPLVEAKRIAERHGVRLEPEVWASTGPTEVILELARRHRPDLLVVGAGHRRRRTALKIARRSVCPVMIVTERDGLRSAA
jgi:nucleotide-binding universal stress UspA family protein